MVIAITNSSCCAFFFAFQFSVNQEIDDCLFQQLTGLALEQLSPAKLANLLLMKAPNNDWSWRPNLTQMCHFNVAAILVRDHPYMWCTTVMP